MAAQWPISIGGRKKTSSSATATIPSGVAKKCLQLRFPDQRYTNEAVELSSELLRMLVVEARRRAAIEAECEAGAEVDPPPAADSPGGRGTGGTDSSAAAVGGDVGGSVEIRADHVARVAAELLFDLS